MCGCQKTVLQAPVETMTVPPPPPPPEPEQVSPQGNEPIPAGVGQ